MAHLDHQRVYREHVNRTERLSSRPLLLLLLRLPHLLELQELLRGHITHTPLPVRYAIHDINTLCISQGGVPINTHPTL